jgi:hypothetical protein
MFSCSFAAFRQTHLQARVKSRSRDVSKIASYLNSGTCRSVPVLSGSSEIDPPIIRSYNFPTNGVDGWTNGEFLYPSESPLNFTPLQSLNQLLPSALDRVVREVPMESNSEILKRAIRPEFASECVGTPRQEFQGGMIDGVRVRAIANPYFKPYGQIRKQFDRWKSRHWERWNPHKVGVRGSSKTYNVPRDIFPRKDELGDWADPDVNGRYQADIRRQYAMNGLPWIYKKDFRQNKMHILDKEPLGPKRWYKREYRIAKIKEAMRNMDQLVAEYRKERKAAQKKTWFEQIVQKLVGTQLASKYITERRIPKL